MQFKCTCITDVYKTPIPWPKGDPPPPPLVFSGPTGPPNDMLPRASLRLSPALRSPEPDMNLKYLLHAGLGVDSYSIDYSTPAVLYFARNWQMVKKKTLADGRKELYMSDRFEHPTTQQVLLNRRAILSLTVCPQKIALSHDITRSMHRITWRHIGRPYRLRGIDVCVFILYCLVPQNSSRVLGSVGSNLHAACLGQLQGCRRPARPARSACQAGHLAWPGSSGEVAGGAGGAIAPPAGLKKGAPK